MSARQPSQSGTERWPPSGLEWPLIVVTRLRLKDPALLDKFFTDALAAVEQAQQALPLEFLYLYRQRKSI